MLCVCVVVLAGVLLCGCVVFFVLRCVSSLYGVVVLAWCVCGCVRCCVLLLHCGVVLLCVVGVRVLPCWFLLRHCMVS